MSKAPLKLPRGTPETAAKATAPAARWTTPQDLNTPEWTYQPGRIFLGRAGDRIIGVGDDRHILTVAGSRSGKSKSCLIPNLYLWPGSAVVIDPKGELATLTAPARAAMGQAVHVVDPFGEVQGDAARFRAAFNPLDVLNRPGSPDVADDAALLADALIMDSGGDTHWTDSARALIKGLLLFILSAEGVGAKNLNTLRDLVQREFEGDADAETVDLLTMFRIMAQSDAFEGIVAGAGRSFAGKTQGEMRSILSTAVVQTEFLSGQIAATLERSDFSLNDLKRRPMTVYLVLPASRMATHARWFRLMVTLTLSALEREKATAQHPVLMVLEEFPQLGRLRQIEAAAGLMAGYGVKLWTVLQDLSQLKALYRDGWETFIGNAGLVQAFGNSDATTLEYLSKRLGTISVAETTQVNATSAMFAAGDSGTRSQMRAVPLLAPFEIEHHFARETGLQMVLIPGRPPAAVERVFFNDPIFDRAKA